MMWRTMLGCGVLVLVGVSALGAKDDKAAPAGVWARQGGQLRLEFADKDVLKIAPHGDQEVVLIVCSYKVGKDGRVKARVTEIDGQKKEQAKNVVPVGLEFSFTWQVKDDRATLGEIKGDRAEALKSHLEGEYEKK